MGKTGLETPAPTLPQGLRMELLDGTTGGDVICKQAPTRTTLAGPRGPACMAMGVHDVLHLTK